MVPTIEGARPGDVIAGKFRVERVLGSGGMGVVVGAIHLELDQPVAIKLLYPHLATDEALAGRFAREARAAVKIKGEHVVRVMDVGRLDSGVPYLVMEYLDGRDLGSVAAGGTGVSVEQACTYVLQACEALASAHAHGFVHRDVKPDNLFLTHRDDGSVCVKVLDFGITKVPNKGTTSSLPVGTPIYMSPEQMQSPKDVDARTDIWAIGVVLYELVARRLPFEGETLPALSMSIAHGTPIPLRKRAPYAPAAFEAVVMRCLEKDPKARFADVAELAEALSEFAPAAAGHAKRAWATLRGSAQMPRRRFVATEVGMQPTEPLMARHQAETVAASTPEVIAAPPSPATPAPRSAGGTRRALWIVAIAGALAGTVVLVALVRGRSSAATPGDGVVVPASAPSVEAPPLASPSLPSVEPAGVQPSATTEVDPTPGPARASAPPRRGPLPKPAPSAAPPAAATVSGPAENPLKRRK